jgi:hypothetical protein
VAPIRIDRSHFDTSKGTSPDRTNLIPIKALREMWGMMQAWALIGSSWQNCSLELGGMAQVNSHESPLLERGDILFLYRPRVGLREVAREPLFLGRWK